MRKGVWDDSNTDLSRYRLSNMELLQKHASIVSKNKEAARIEWAQKQALLKQGIVPKEMQELIKKPKPAPVKKECKSTLKRQTSARPSSAGGTVGIKTQQARFSGLRTTAGVDPQGATLKPESVSNAVDARMPTKDDTFESLKRLDEAMSQLERAMVSAIQDPAQTKGEIYAGKSSPGKTQKYSPGKPGDYCGEQPRSSYLERPQTEFQDRSQTYSPEKPKIATFDIPEPYFPDKPQGYSYSDRPQTYSSTRPQACTASHPDDEDEVSESSVFSLSPDHSQDTFNPQKYRDDYDEDVISVPPMWQDYENVRPATAQPPPASCYEPKTSEAAGTDPFKEQLAEPNICSVETADYLAQMLEQTRKDLEQMQIPDQCTQAGDDEDFPQLPPVQSFGRNYEGDLMPRPYILKPVAKELYNPIVRSAGQLSNSLSLGSSLGPAPQKYPLKDSLR